MNDTKTKKTRNYAIDFYRFLFALGFIVGHIAIVGFRSFAPKESGYNFAFDTMIIFIALSGYFMMQNFKRQQKRCMEENIHPVTQAWTYLKSRIKGLGPWFLAANLLGFVALRVWKGTPITEWFDALLNHLPEFFGLMLTGLGFGTPYDGMYGYYGRLPAETIFLCQPLWFVSGLFITSFLLYFLLAKNEKFTLGVIIPFTSMILYGSLYMTEVQPNWPFFLELGSLRINVAMVDMFCGLGLGCLIWTAVDALKEKQFTKPVVVVMTIVQAFLMLFIPFRTLAPTNIPINPFSFSWPTAYILSLIFCFLVTLNKDKATKVMNIKAFGYLGGLAMYIYMFHFPIIILVHAICPTLFADSLGVFVLIVVVITFILAISAEKANKKLQAWIAKEPWFVKGED